jgi:hypothetical protein
MMKLRLLQAMLYHHLLTQIQQKKRNHQFKWMKMMDKHLT